MIKSRFARAFILGICLAVFSSTAAFAESDKGGGQTGLIGAGMQAVKAEPAIDSELLQKQQEIDEYVFKTHASELAEKGITVTHTGPVDKYVEIGITPYGEESAEYLYGIFGKETVKVVEGQQAVLLTADNAPDASVSDRDKAANGQDKVAITAANDAELYAAVTATTTSAEDDSATGMSSAMMVIIISGAVIVLGGGAILAARRLKTAGR